jgi:P-loop Domain of unknown function (DUF2791)
VNGRMQEWLQAIDREYLADYILAGGGCVKFAVGSTAAEEIREDLESAALRRGFVFIELGAAHTRLHRSDEIFFEVAKNIDWDRLAERYVASAFERNGWAVSPAANSGAPFDLGSIAAAKNLNEGEVRAFLRDTLLRLYEDHSMSQEFRLALIQICRARIAGMDHFAGAVTQWLRGELRRISEVKGAKLFQKIGRRNGRLMLESLTRWLRRNGSPGLVLTIDIGRCLENVRKADRGAGYYYSPAALTEVYEVLRQLIDSAYRLEGTMIAIFAPSGFLTDEKRGVDRYQALKMRVFDDVRSRGLQNVLAPLVRLGEVRAEETAA